MSTPKSKNFLDIYVLCALREYDRDYADADTYDCDDDD